MACELGNIAKIPYIPYITTMPGSRECAHSSGNKVVLTLVALTWLWWGGQHLLVKGWGLHAFSWAVEGVHCHCLGDGPAGDGVDRLGFTGSITSLGRIEGVSVGGRVVGVVVVVAVVCVCVVSVFVVGVQCLALVCVRVCCCMCKLVCLCVCACVVEWL